MSFTGQRAGFDATVTRSALGAPGTLALALTVEDIPGAADFLIALDASVLAGFTGRTVWRKAKVELGFEPVLPLVGSISIEESLDNPIASASFEVLSDRCAQNDPTSWGWGDQAASITLYAGKKPATMAEWLAFEGWTDSRSNAGLYKARGSFHCVGLAAAWAGTPGCIRVGPFRGMTRGALLAAYATSVGTAIANSDILDLGAVVSRPVEINGSTLLEVAQRFGEIERWMPRVTIEGALEIVTFDSILTDTPVFTFDPTTYFTIEEAPVESPPTKLVLSGSFIPDSIRLSTGGAETVRTEKAGIDSDGLPTLTITDVTTTAGIVTGVRVEEKRTFARDGTTAEAAVLQTYSVVEEVWRYQYADLGDGVERPTTQLHQYEKHTWLVTGVPCHVGYLLGNLWLTGGWYVGTRAALIEVGFTTVENEWNPASASVSACTLARESIVEYALYSKLAGAISGYAYLDGSEREDEFYILQAVRLDEVTWRDFRDRTTPEVQKETWLHSLKVDSVYGGEILVKGDWRLETWTMEAAGATHRHRIIGTSSVPGAALWGGTYSTTTTVPPVDEVIDGPLLGPPVGSTDAALLRQTVQVNVYDWSEVLPFVPKTESETIEFAETPAELDRVAEWRMLIARGEKLVIRHRLLPFLKVGSPVLITSAPRSITLRRAIVWTTKRTVVLPDQATSQETLVYLLPEG